MFSEFLRESGLGTKVPISELRLEPEILKQHENQTNLTDENKCFLRLVHFIVQIIYLWD